MKIVDNILQAIGNTPLIRLDRIAAGSGMKLLAKAESLNPGGSVKDRIGLAMIDDAERRGLLKPGGTIIEATAGNTGVGLALVAAIRGYRCIFVMPDKMSEEKVNLLKAYGAEVVITPTSVSPDSPQSYNGVADRLTREIPGAFRPGQFSNPQNPEAHYRTTGPEIWEATAGQIDVFVAGMGTGGTISGVGRYLKERKPEVLVVGADPAGSILSGDSPSSYKVEGIGEDFIPATFNRQAVDEFVRVTDQESFATARALARQEGLLAGGSAGTAVAAAIKFGRRLPAGKVVVALLPDTGRNYLTKFFSDEWMRENGFAIAAKPKVAVRELLAVLHKNTPTLISVTPGHSAKAASAVLRQHDISQIPVILDGKVVGSLDEMTFAKLLSDGVDLDARTVGEIMGRSLPTVDLDVDLEEPYRLLMSGVGGVVVAENGLAVAFITRIDLVNYWSVRRRPAA